MICDSGDVVVVPFPFVDLPVVKRRPAVVLSNQRFNRDNGNTILAMITTAQASSWPSDIRIADETAAGLKHASVIRWKVFTVPNDRILRRAGHLSAADKGQTAQAARRVLETEPI